MQDTKEAESRREKETELYFVQSGGEKEILTYYTQEGSDNFERD